MFSECLTDAGATIYESEVMLSQYCELHYGREYFGIANFPRSCATLCRGFMGKRRKERALDLGCAVGRATLELALDFSHVSGVDLSRGFIRAARRLKEEGRLSYRVAVEGDLFESVELDLAALGLDRARDRVSFVRADAAALPEGLRDFDLIFAGNLIDRLPFPRLFLSALHERIIPGGLLALASPYTWLSGFTPRQEWLGGFSRDGKDVHALDGLTEVLSPRFRLVEAPLDVPFVIRETARKYQHCVSQMTVWERRRT